MTGYETLLGLAKSKLNITWNDEGTNARLEAILAESVPAVSNMVGLGFDYENNEAVDGKGETFDYSQPSMERNVLMNFIAYEWNHKAELFRDAYCQDIQACRQRHALEVEDGGE
ncbi:MAG: hypothetical protein LUD72_12095 [Bacteroidales bacterium]|nr:hypothetical protein [Bacteroidales bacterium]